MDKMQSDTPQQQLKATPVQEMDGALRLVFTLSPSGQYVGEMSLRSLAPDVVAPMVTIFAQWVQALKGTVQVAPVAALGALDAARKHVNGEH